MLRRSGPRGCGRWPWGIMRIGRRHTASSNTRGRDSVESPGGISPPGAPRSVHEPLDSHGSRCSAASMAQLPMSEERRICAAKPIKPVARSFGLATQPLKFAARPADEEINPPLLQPLPGWPSPSRLGMSNGFPSSTGSSCCQLASVGPWPRLNNAASRFWPLETSPFASERQVLTFHTRAWLSFAPSTCRMPLGQTSGFPRADPGGRVSSRF
jgi:hypothetical protein